MLFDPNFIGGTTMSIRYFAHAKRRLILRLLAMVVLMIGLASMVSADILTSSDGQLVTKKDSFSESTQPVATRTSSLSTAAQATVSAVAGREDQSYHAVVQGKGFHAENPRHAMNVDFTPEGVQVRTGTSRWGLTLSSYGYGDRLDVVSASAPNATANRVEYRRGTVTEWYINGPMGLEQGFTLSRAPQERHEGPLTLGLRLSGDLTASVGLREDELTLKQGDGEAVLRYCALTAYDATGQQLNAWVKVKDGQLLLRVDDAGAMYPILVDPFVQTTKLSASDGAVGDHFGYDVAISGDTVVIGTNGANGNQGAAYVFVKPASGWGGQLIETAKLRASDGAAGDDFGSSVAISGNAVIVGANGAKIGVNSDQGAAYVFVKPASGWGGNLTQTAKLTASDGAGNDDFGWDVAISGDTVAVGAQQYFSNQHGAVYVFVKPASGWGGNLTETAKLTGSNGANGDAFGNAVSISGDTVVVGADMAQKYTNITWGAVYVFVKPISGWGGQLTETAKLILSNSESVQYFAGDVAIDGDTVVVEADYPWLPIHNTYGLVYVFVKTASGWGGNIIETAKLTSTDKVSEGGFGLSLSISGDKVVVGDPFADDYTWYGKAYLFVKPASGWGGHLTETAQLLSPDTVSYEPLFGGAVAISGDTVVGGATGAGATWSNEGPGAAYMFVTKSYASLNGIALVPDPYKKSKVLGYLSDGEAFAFQTGNVFSFAPIQLPHGAIIDKLRCVVKDNTLTGSIKVNLLRGPINITDAVTPVQVIASTVTLPATVSSAFQEISQNANPSFAVVDNTKYGYFFRVYFLAAPAQVGTNVLLSLRGCIVEYEH